MSAFVNTIEKSGTGIEKSGTGIEKSGTGIEKSGTGIERSGTGIERSGTGVSRFSHLLWSLTIGLVFLASSVSAQDDNLPVFASHSNGVLQVSVHLAEDIAVGSFHLEPGKIYDSVPLFAGLTGALGCKVNGSGTGDKSVDCKVNGSGTGEKVNGSGTGDKTLNGCRVNGSGTGDKGCEIASYEWGVAEVSIDDKQIHVLVYAYESGRLAEVGHTVIDR